MPIVDKNVRRLSDERVMCPIREGRRDAQGMIKAGLSCGAGTRENMRSRAETGHKRDPGMGWKGMVRRRSLH